MRLKFDLADGIRYAIATNEQWGDYIVEELLFAEVSESLGAFKVVWCDDFSKPEHFDSITEARQHVLANYNLHTPVLQGKKTFSPVNHEDEE